MFDENQDEQNAAKARMARDQAAMIKDIQRVFGSDVGRAVLKHLVTRFYMGNTAYSSDPYSMYFAEGQRAVVRYLMDQLKFDADDLLKQATE